jgi:hypothetical protein
MNNPFALFLTPYMPINWGEKASKREAGKRFRHSKINRRLPHIRPNSALKPANQVKALNHQHSRNTPGHFSGQLKSKMKLQFLLARLCIHIRRHLISLKPQLI